ncbi:papilin isoform X2 [Chelonus insularis]|uniref:papilin isoform X2 n=1 Tax=Chelonus insularis TaxID=460826 RepID=UPI0015891986|nr:papilin isoform X2 [Chelonus insularis]
MTNVHRTWSLVLLVSIAIWQITDTAAKYHHIKFRHGKHRRRHTEGYLPSSFVTDNNDPEEGLWGAWSTPSSCSRSCGGGIAYQTRHCLDVDSNGYDRCTGAKKRFFSCNIQPCPNPVDFRAEQCAEFNSKPFEGVFYEWIPYTGAPNKCELNCMPRGERFFYRHKRSVIDGTPCDVEKNDVCVEGKCMTVGCDMMLGSDAREDACRECGGDGSDCNTVNGSFETNDLQAGYIDILLIPEGATNIVIKEVAPSNNYLAIRNTTGHYYLNGNWRIDFPRSIKFANTIFHYSRDPQGFSAPDMITALGPTNEAIYVVLLYQDRNVGVQYEYSIPKKLAPQADPDSYTWTADEFSECSVSCGGGYQSRQVMCIRRRDNEQVDDHLCDLQLEPDDTQSCNEEACPPQWVESEWTPCNKLCGEGGERTREIKCEQIIAGGIPTVVDDSVCIEKVGVKNETTQKCNENVECPMWHIGPWKPCDHLCGKGKQTRKITCYRKNESGKIEVLPNSSCEGEMPESEKPCELRPCAGLDWVVSEWSGCNDKCGLVQETRTAHCTTQDGTVYPDDKCDPDKKPELTRECESAKDCEYQWYTTQWSECSAKCGKGVQTRIVFCATFEDETTLKKVSDDNCDAAKRYNDTKECTADIVECKGEWFAGPWSKCSKPCGGGDMTRKVICMKNNMSVSVSECDEDSIMFSTEECNKHPCSEDEILPVEPMMSTIPPDEDDECEVYEDEDYVTMTSILTSDEDEQTGSTESSSDIKSSMDTDSTVSDDIMLSDSPRGDTAPTDIGSGYGSGEGSDDDILSTLFTNIPVSGSDLSTFEGSGASVDDKLTTIDISSIETVSASSETSLGITDTTEKSTTVESSSYSGITDVTFDETSSVTQQSSSDETSSIFSTLFSSSTLSSLFSSSSDTSTEMESSESSSSSPLSTDSIMTDSSTVSSASEITDATESTSDSSSDVTSTDETQSSTVSSSDTTLSASQSSTVSSSDETESTSESSTVSSSDVTSTDMTESTMSTSSDETESTSEFSTMSTSSDITESTPESSTMLSSTSDTSSTDASQSTSESSSDETLSTDATTETSDSTTDFSSSEISTTSDRSTAGTTTKLPFSILPIDGESEIEKPHEGTTKLSTSDVTSESTSPDMSTTESSGSTESSMMTTSFEDSTTSSSTDTSLSTSEETTLTGITESSSSSTMESEKMTESGETTETTESMETSTPFGSSTMTSESESSSVSEETSQSSVSTEVSMSTESVTDASSTSTETSVSGVTEMTDEEDTDLTSKSSVLDLFTTANPLSTAIAKEHKLRKCKIKRKKKTCKTSKFGCCYDGVSEAQGPFGKGCPTPETCAETKFGCCPDGVSVATGPNNDDCPSSHCNETLFGCCQNGITPAEGNDFEGCKKPCNETEFGCCPDKETPASGKNNYGCCNTTKHGCCPDGIEAASGPNQEGCKKKLEEDNKTDCSNSTYGCCPDGQKPATGINFEGCGVINTDNCSASYFGCCSDNVTAALGPNGEGCHAPCESSEFGCCQDRVTPAHGPNGEGCCLTSPYKCCPDNILPARGPDLYGCGCQYTRFRCCPDNTTAARGPNNEGCGCEYTTHGCCPNKFTPATGPNYEGCPCYTYQFGCCPDGISIAKGPRGHGCNCETTEFKCCSDGRTPAKGPNFAGCACDASKYGCCPDGIEEAQGDHFEGCRTVPTPPGSACSLAKDRGSCRDFSVKWFFDTEYGGCSRFWYGGCEGNNNRFNTQEECRQVCVEPKGRDACYLPKSTGPCEGYHPMWYYDTEREQCGQFIYGGCLGNDNKFETREKCEDLCVIPDDIDPCELEKEKGPCNGNYTRWYFNKESQICEQFQYGGCKSNTNNFPTEAACHQQCLQPGRRRDYCLLPRTEGNCTEKYPKWYFDPSENRCMPFYYTGCNGNKNNFDTREACELDCPPKIEQDICLLPAVLGKCHNYTQRWYYDSFEKRCRQFYYGGCEGNENNFLSEQECSNRCETSGTPPPTQPQRFSPAMCFLPYEHGPCTNEQTKWFYDSRDGTCKQFNYGGCATNGNKFESLEECEYRCGNIQDVCSMPKVIGPCSGSLMQFYYNRDTDTCEEFEYSECGGNKNRFQDRETCESRCKRRPAVVRPEPPTSAPTPSSEIVPSSPICTAPVDAGSCDLDITAYYYDSRTGVCQAFLYGGCEGNANRFQSEEQCERLCGRFQGQEVCNLPMDSGPCRGSFAKYYYDSNARICRPFYYGGCDGNANRFSSVAECESVCLHREEPTPLGNNTGLSQLAANNELSPDRNETKDPCSDQEDQCNVIQCPYGKEAFVDEQNCERCRCVNPCRSVQCSEGSQCSITLVASPSGGTEYRAVCRTTTKPGQCPQVSNSTRCERECSSDADCPQDWKCCDNGCGTSCLEPALEQPPPVPVHNITAPPHGAEPAAIQQPEQPHVSGEEGGYVQMKCIATGNPKPVLTWKKDATVINVSEPRRRILSDGTLEIINLYSYDRGIYICIADNGLAPPVKTEYQLEVTEPHDRSAAIVGETNSSITVVMNSPSVLHCYAMGWPRPSVTWWHGERLLPLSSESYEQDSEYTLLIRSVTITNLGVYTCQAYNGIERPASWSITLQAIGPVYNVKPEYAEYTKYLVQPPKSPNIDRPQYPYRPSKPNELDTYHQTYAPIYSDNKPYIPPVISLTESPPQPTVFKVPVSVNVSTPSNEVQHGSQFSITCKVDGYPIPQVLWYKDNDIIRTDGRVSISESNTLVVDNAGSNDTGVYRCEAYNAYSSSSDYLKISVQGSYISADCIDTKFFARCDLIVMGKYCQHPYYAKFCCRSCTEAGQLPGGYHSVNNVVRKRRSIGHF